MSTGPGLQAIQRWMQEVITHPDGAPMDSMAAADSMARVVRPSATLSAEARVALYHGAYRARLLSAFREMFPALRHATGDELLDAFATDYLAEHPPSSFTIGNLAHAFPEHLEATRPDSGSPPEAREAWPDFLVELARLERSVLDIAEGPGLEGRSLPDARAILGLPAPQLLGLVPVPAPCLRVFSCAWPVQRYLQTVRRGGTPELPQPARSLFAVSRREYRVVFHDLSPAQHALLGGCDGQRSIADALERIPPGLSADVGNVRDWLCEWTSRGFLEAI